jgi:hypothetical protein
MDGTTRTRHVAGLVLVVAVAIAATTVAPAGARIPQPRPPVAAAMRPWDPDLDRGMGRGACESV